MGIISEIAAEAESDYVLAKLKQFIAEKKSYGDDLDIDTFYSEFNAFLKKKRGY